MSRRFCGGRIRAAIRPRASTTRTVRFVALPAALVVLAIAAPSTVFGAAKGIQTDMTWGVDSATQTTDASSMTDLGVSWTRMTLSWHDVETSPGSYSKSKLSEIDNAVSLANASGINVIMDVYESPQWASGSSDKNTPPQNPQDYANFVHAMAQRYAGKVAAWEIWNEENTGQFWGGSPSASAYAQLLKDAYPAVKSADANALVVFGGISTNDWAYVEQVYNAAPDIGSDFDVMATHPYTPQAAPDVVNFDDPSHIDRLSFAGYRTVRLVMLAHGTDKPIWFTEMGWATTSQPDWGVSAQQQADYTKEAWACMQQDAYVQVAILYELRNNYWAGNADDWNDQLGITNVDWSHKPAYDAFKSVDPTVGGCTYETPAGVPVAPSGQESPPPPVSTQPTPPPTSTPASPPSTSTSTSTSTEATTTATSTQPTNEAAPTSTSSAGSAAGTSITTQSSPTPEKPKISLHVRPGVAHFTVFGALQGATGGSVVLSFQHRVNGRWVEAQVTRVRVGSDGSFATKRLKAFSKGGWRVRGAYSTKAVSSFVYFKA